MMLEKSPGACNDFLLLACVDTGGGTAEILMLAQTHFSKYEQALLLHDEINLAGAAAIVGGDQFKALGQQKIARGVFSGLTVLLRLLPRFYCRATRSRWQFHC